MLACLHSIVLFFFTFLELTETCSAQLIRRWLLGAMENLDFSYILNSTAIREKIKEWLIEDIPAFDFGGLVVGSQTETAVLLCKSSGVLCGIPFVNAVFQEVGCNIEWCETEGCSLFAPIKVATVTGPANSILKGERLALNILSRASGVATLARKCRNIASSCRWSGEIAATRKTTPGFRMVEKYALLVGGVSQHRYDLSSMVMLKDNHIWTAGNITKVS